MVQKVIRDRLDAILHWNISLVGGFLGAYAILLHAGNFGSAQTGNLMEMGAELVSMEWFNVLLRLAALVLFGLGVASAYLLTNFTKINMRKLALWVDAAALALASMLPLEPALVGIYPIFFASAFQWGVYSGADGFNSATIFMTNNFKQSVLGWLQYGLTKDKEFKRKAILYTYTVISFFLGVVLGAWAVGQFGIYSAYVGFLPLAAARTFIAVGGVMSNGYLRKSITEICRYKSLYPCFAKAEYSSDNATGNAFGAFMRYTHEGLLDS